MRGPGLDDPVSDYRPSLHETLIHCAFAFAARGTCTRAQVGAVFAVDGRIVSTGYNGAPVGMPHCDHRSFVVPGRPGSTYVPAFNPQWVDWPEWLRPYFTPQGRFVDAVWKFDEVLPGSWFRYDNGDVTRGLTGDPDALDAGPPCRNAVHAEANAVAFAARSGVALAGSTLYTTLAPCLACAQLVINVGAAHVVAAEAYRDDAGTALLKSAGIGVTMWHDDEISKS